MTRVEIRHFHLFCGLGSGAKGFNKANPRVGSMEGEFSCIGGIDIDAVAIANFESLTGCPGTVRDLMSAEQYQAFHGCPPPEGWQEATPADIQNAAGGQRPHIVFLSAPCKGFSGLLSQNLSNSAKYQALNELTLRGIWLSLEAWKDDPAELMIFENVPRIANRGRHLLDQITQLLRSYGYAVAETTHDCGEIGGLAQSRRRFLLVARHEEKVPPFLYEPPKKTLRAVGDILGAMPLPGLESAGPMHRIPSLQWKTWVRLAFVEAGKDWRSLNRLEIEDGYLRDYLVVPEYRPGYMGVRQWDEPTGTIAGRSSPTNGAFSVADPRYEGQQYSQFGVLRWDETAGVVTGQRSPGQGRFSVADPRHHGTAKHSNAFRITPWHTNAGTVTSAHGSGQCVQDPRPGGQPTARSKYRVTRYDESSGSVIAASTTGEGAFAVADPRPGFVRKKGDHYLTAGHYGVVPWNSPAGAVSAAAGHDNGRWTVADPRTADAVPNPEPGLPAATERLVAEITSLDGTWHRPFTTLELAALQSIIEPEEYLALHGRSDSTWREQIGNAVPANAAAAIGETMGETLLLAWTGETFVLSPEKVWVQPLRVALSVDQRHLEATA
ncbi:Site-specific DNA methylase [Marinobacter salarius]|uniref:DNA cytosine methyltransferase n=1 Tax=Marinobacter salarius TaxID=1420917 RepID=UPI001251B6A6|nr:DNA cytosine methyltransferase [Marinobacter salarius]VVT03032.1 Site-specific DNA methylase [Marinobacter salarius]VXC24100.1 Site-specific DNA methylase [Marinobacter salarius]